MPELTPRRRGGRGARGPRASRWRGWTRSVRRTGSGCWAWRRLLARRVVGQDAAVEAVADAVRSGRAGLAAPGRPMGSLLFVGPTGVGKTELARALAAALHDSEPVRFDMARVRRRLEPDAAAGGAPGARGARRAGAADRGAAPRPVRGAAVRRGGEGAPGGDGGAAVAAGRGPADRRARPQRGRHARGGDADQQPGGGADPGRAGRRTSRRCGSRCWRWRGWCCARNW